MAYLKHLLSILRKQHTKLDKANEFEWLKPYGTFSNITIYNTSAQRKVPLVFTNDYITSWYTCGPTVYDSAHLGHASCYVKLDIVQRILREQFNCNLVTAMNVTDIDDKIIARSQKVRCDWRELSRGYEAEFWNDLHKLNVTPPTIKLRVTDYIPQIVHFIKYCINSKSAYIGNDNSVYFDVKKSNFYGKLQKVNLNDIIKTNDDTGVKNSSADFALWKAKKAESEPSWDAPWGPGRPGWHIECSALATMLFGKTVDFHAGGMDLRFPHHENEEAQCCAFHGVDQWVNYWVHPGQLNIKGSEEKMSKSLGNTISVSQMLDSYTADDFRMACLLSNYRSSMSYSTELMDGAHNTLRKFLCFNDNCNAYVRGIKPWKLIDEHALLEQLKHTVDEVDNCLRDDFNTATAMMILCDQVSSINRILDEQEPSCNQDNASSCISVIIAIQSYITSMMRCFGIKAFEAETLAQEEMNKEVNLKSLMDDIIILRTSIRERAIAEKNNELFKICDNLRNILGEYGVELRDHRGGSSWSLSKTVKVKN